MENILEKAKTNLGLRNIYYYILSKSFNFFERYLKIHILPVSYYSPVPNISKLNPHIFEKVYSQTGLDWNVDGQLDYLHSVFTKYHNEYIPSANSGLSLVDSCILYAMIREARPKIIIEVGSGESTKISLRAVEKNSEEGNKCNLYAIDPYPRSFLKKISSKNFELIDKRLEEVNMDFLTRADVFFIDSSHVSKVGSDVNHELLEVLPRLKKDTLIHWHDIVIPNDYYKDWVCKEKRFWNESYMLHAFMLFNDSYKIQWASHYMQLNYEKEIQKEFSYFQPQMHLCTSFWVQKIK